MFFKANQDLNVKQIMFEKADFDNIAQSLAASFNPKQDTCFKNPSDERMLISCVVLVANSDQQTIVGSYPAYQIILE